MRYLVLTDIHANLDALDAVLKDAGRFGYDHILVLGDLVGYGAEPNGVIDRVIALEPLVIVRGNHDKVASGIEDADDFNAVAQRAVSWTLANLSPEHREWLAALPRGPELVDPLVEVCHGSPFDEDAYIFSELDALRALRASHRPVCLFGHTHFPAIYRLSDSRFDVSMEPTETPADIVLEEGWKYLMNPGSVGQPRDGDPRAAYAIVDETARKVTLYRVAYPLEEAQEKVIRAGLPEALALRLAAGR